MEVEVIFEDADIVVVNKPPGVVVNRAKSAPGKTIQDWMEERYQFSTAIISEDKSWWSLVPEEFDPQYGEPEQLFFQRSGMVHRLDKDTSGVMVLAKNPGAMLALMAQFKQREVQKTYQCLVHGIFAQDSDTIRLPLGRSQHNRQRFSVVADGRPAETHFTVLQRYQFAEEPFLDTVEQMAGEKRRAEIARNLRVYEGFSLVECLPKTGRTHQIRVHMAHLQHPLVGDSLYVGKKRARLDEFWCPRQFLHAHQLQLTHPRTNEELELMAELPEDLESALTYLTAEKS